MRAYVIASGLLFGLICCAHIARVILEGPGMLHDPVFIGASLIAVGMTLWSAAVLRRHKREG